MKHENRVKSSSEQCEIFLKCPSPIASCCDLTFKKSHQKVKFVATIFRYQLGGLM